MSLCIGIDLHGTLITDKEKIDENLKGPLKEILGKLVSPVKLYICTGNDLGFVQRKIDKEILDLFHGYILEMGCVFSRGKDEQVLVEEEKTRKIKELEEKLKLLSFPQVYKFAHRLTTISLFTRYGYSPRLLYPEVQEWVKRLGYDDLVGVVYSSVAVDIVPKNYDKFSGLKFVSHGSSTVGIADSMNDLSLLINADYSFILKNAAQELIDRLNTANKRVMSIKNASRLKRDRALQSSYPSTRGLIEILQFIEASLDER